MRIDNIPADLRETGKFCLWKYEDRDGKSTKVPYSPYGGKAAANNPQTFSDFSRVSAVLEQRPGKYSGMGIGLFGDLVGIDIDHCVEDGQLAELAEAVVELMDSYCEFSPSGTGLHILCRAPGLSFDKDRYYTKNPHNGVEVYAAGFTSRFLTLTGDTLNNTGVNTRTAEVVELLETYMLREVSNQTGEGIVAERSAEECAEKFLALDGAEILDRMLSSAKGEAIAALWAGKWHNTYASQSEADMALCSHLAFWTGKDAILMDYMFRQSGLMRDKWDRPQSGSTYGAITIENAISRCVNVWLPDFQSACEMEVTDQVEQALEFLKEVDAVHNARYTLDDVGSGYLLADYLRPFARPVPESKGWKVYDGKRWKTDVGEVRVVSTAKHLSRALACYAATLPDKERHQYLSFAGLWARNNKRNTYVQEAKSEHPVSESEFDKDKWLLNVNNGTLDLRTGVLHPHNPDDLITKLAPVDYDPAATCPRWDRFIEEIMEPGADEDLGALDVMQATRQKAQFLQRYLGYCLSGDTREESFLVMYGPTSRNGKSVCVEALRTVMGNYARNAQAATLMVSGNKDGRGPSEDIARLAGARMVSVGELPQSGRMDAAVVKQLTGRDAVSARFLNENSFEFIPQFKLLLHTNHLPQCSDLSVFDSGRVLVLPFSRHFEPHEQDKGLKDKFCRSENQSAILNWLLRGLADYQKNGLNPPAAVLSAISAYRKNSDKIARFVEEVLTEYNDAEVRTAMVYESFCEWCRDNGYQAENSQNFLRGLERIGLTTKRKKPRDRSGSTTTMLLGYKIGLPGAHDEIITHNDVA